MHMQRLDAMQPGRADERTLVVVFLRGGADGLTLVPPVADDAYHRARPVLRVRPDEALRLDDRFGLNPALAALLPHFREGRLAIVHGAGSDDTTRSHFEAQDRMEHGGDTGGGWLGRYLLATQSAPSALSAVAIGTTRPESLRGAPGGAVIQTVRDFGFEASADTVARLERLYELEPGALGQAGRSTLEAVRALRELRAQDPGMGSAPYPATAFGRGMREIARLIKANVGMVATTIDMSGPFGWDTHFVQSQAIPSQMKELADGVDAFWTDLGDARSRVTVVCMTEFGRRVAENSSFGTDHGAGSAMLVLGQDLPSAGPLRAGAVHAGFGALEEGSLIGPGDVPVTTDYREVLLPILRQHAPNAALDGVFPRTNWR